MIDDGNNGEWYDGVSTLSQHIDTMKMRLEYYPNDRVIEKLSRFLFHSIHGGERLLNLTAGFPAAAPFITRTPTGGFFSPHHDAPENGDYSTTIFLNDDCKGGDLCLWVDGEVVSFKPKAGMSVTYKTGTNHSVSEVTEGNRDAIVFWTNTHIKDPYEFELYSSIIKVMDLLAESYPVSYPESLEDADTNPMFILDSMKASMLRRNSTLVKYQ